MPFSHQGNTYRTGDMWSMSNDFHSLAARNYGDGNNSNRIPAGQASHPFAPPWAPDNQDPFQPQRVMSPSLVQNPMATPSNRRPPVPEVQLPVRQREWQSQSHQMGSRRMESPGLDHHHQGTVNLGDTVGLSFWPGGRGYYGDDGDDGDGDEWGRVSAVSGRPSRTDAPLTDRYRDRALHMTFPTADVNSVQEPVRPLLGQPVPINNNHLQVTDSISGDFYQLQRDLFPLTPVPEPASPPTISYSSHQPFLHSLPPPHPTPLQPPSRFQPFLAPSQYEDVDQHYEHHQRHEQAEQNNFDVGRDYYFGAEYSVNASRSTSRPRSIPSPVPLRSPSERLPSSIMPPARKRSAPAPSAPRPNTKRPQNSNEQSDGRSTKRTCLKVEEDNTDNFLWGNSSQLGGRDIIDLVDLVDVPEAMVKERERQKNLTRVARFQCVICMDDCSHLAITSCGHLFCGGCIHESLHSSTAKSVCPMCRQNIVPRSHTTKKKGRFNIVIKKRGRLAKGKKSFKRRLR